MNDPVYMTHKFEALKLRYEDQVELDRVYMRTDFQIFSGYFTLQLALGAWLVTHSLEDLLSRIGMVTLDFSISMIEVFMFSSHRSRRKEITDTIKNINKVLGFYEESAYGIVINPPPPPSRPFYIAYLAGIFLSFIAIFLITFGGDFTNYIRWQLCRGFSFCFHVTRFVFVLNNKIGGSSRR